MGDGVLSLCEARELPRSRRKPPMKERTANGGNVARPKADVSHSQQAVLKCVCS